MGECLDLRELISVTAFLRLFSHGKVPVISMDSESGVEEAIPFLLIV